MEDAQEEANTPIVIKKVMDAVVKDACKYVSEIQQKDMMTAYILKVIISILIH